MNQIVPISSPTPPALVAVASERALGSLPRIVRGPKSTTRRSTMTGCDKDH
jgi:hypothetical protein